MKTTEEIINEKVEQLRKELLEMAELKAITPIVGKWYKSTVDKAMYVITELNKNSLKNYGFNYDGDWMDLQTRYQEEGWLIDLVEATPTEVQAALEAEAIKRGLVKGVTVKCAQDSTERELSEDYETGFTLNKSVCSLTDGSGAYSFYNGKWATIIPTEKTSVEWANQFAIENCQTCSLHTFLVINNLKIVKQ